MSAFQIKTYLFPTETESISASQIVKANEIRRFNLAVNSSSLYSDLLDKIQAAYGGLLPKREEIKTYWQDDEDELVGFSTDQEMQYAIDVQATMRLSQQKPYESSINSIGQLFKIYIARKKCERHCSPGRSGFHHHYNLHNIHPGVVCDGCEGTISGSRFKCNICPDYDLCTTCKSSGKHKDTEHSFTEISRPQFGNYGHGFGHAFGRNRGGFGHCRRHRQSPPTSTANATADSTSTPTPTPNLHERLQSFMPYISANIPMVNDPEQLKNVGEYLKTFLDPFGIDVDYYIDTINKSTATAKAEEKKDEKEKEKKQESDSTEANKTNSEATEKPMDTTPLFTGDSVTTPKPSTSETVPASAPSASMTKEPELIHLSDSSPYLDAANALNKVIASQEEEIAKLNKDEETDSGFNLVDIEKELKIIKAIEQLKQMGYGDDGGWLTRLVSAKNGNINAVLDTIAPK